jgi:hypothetical protein
MYAKLIYIRVLLTYHPTEILGVYFEFVGSVLRNFDPSETLDFILLTN